MTSFVDLADPAAFAVATRSRAIAAGVDPSQYDHITSSLASLRDWPGAFRAAGHEHRARAGQARTAISAGEAYLDAAACAHIATVLPHPDISARDVALAEAARALAEGLPLLSATARRCTGPWYAAWLRYPAGLSRSPGNVTAPPVVIVIPGMDSSMVEFRPVADALLRRGLAVMTIDGPGQGELAATTAPRPDYQVVTSAVIDALPGDVDQDRIGVIALSLGGFYGAVSAAHEPRLRAVAAISGVGSMNWPELPPFVTETLTQRAGGERAAQEFARQIDVTHVAGKVTQPLRVVDGECDVIPGATNGAVLADAAPRAEYLLVPGGDHLVGNARWAWLPGTADWLASHLVASP